MIDRHTVHNDAVGTLCSHWFAKRIVCLLYISTSIAILQRKCCCRQRMPEYYFDFWSWYACVCSFITVCAWCACMYAFMHLAPLSLALLSQMHVVLFLCFEGCKNAFCDVYRFIYMLACMYTCMWIDCRTQMCIWCLHTGVIVHSQQCM